MEARDKSERHRKTMEAFGLENRRKFDVGGIVKYENGWYRVTRMTKKTVNLGSVFGSKIYYKGIPKEEVEEDEAAWYENWSKSETYMSM